MIRNILFDLDDTLLDFHRAEKIAVGRALREMGVAPTEETLRRYSEINAEHWRMLERGELTREQVLVYRFRALFRELGKDTELAGETAEKYENYLCIGHYFMPGAEAALEALYGDFRLYIVSNGTAKVQESRMLSSGIGRYFEDVFISQNTGFNKPEAGFFDYCFRRIPDFCREETTIIGDSLTSDIKGGINAGIRTVWLNPAGRDSGDIKPDYQVRDLDEFVKLVREI